ncbi:MAG: hypothetical protein LBL26_13400 [Peptococcaceae bacterium]|nr:hypothetical protein [Peptococcaceae bacterium]
MPERKQFGFLLPMIKGVYLFWIDYHAFRTSADAEELECKRAYINNFLAAYKSGRKGKACVTGVTFKMYGACNKAFLKYSKGGASLESGAAVESNVFYSELPGHGVFVRDGYEELRLWIYTFLLRRKDEIMSSLDGPDGITPQNNLNTPPDPDAPPALNAGERERRERLIGVNTRAALKKISRKLPGEYICSAETEPSVPGQILTFRAKGPPPGGMELGRVYVTFDCRDMSVKNIRGRMEGGPDEPGKQGEVPGCGEWERKMREMKGIADMVQRVFYNEGLIKTLPSSAMAVPRRAEAEGSGASVTPGYADGGFHEESEAERAIAGALREPRARLERGLSRLSDWMHTEESIHAQGPRVTFSFTHEGMGELGRADVTLSGPGMSASGLSYSARLSGESGDGRDAEREELMREIFGAVREAFGGGG